jgi:phosphatidylserine decarboxylase
MTARSIVTKIFQHERLNFALTNRIPRRLATRFVGWLSKIEQPFVCRASIAVWRFFCNPDLSEAKKEKFTSLRDCFIRELKERARPINPDPKILVSPCDAIIGASGAIHGTDLIQVKGSSYSLPDLLGGDRNLSEFYRDGCYTTLRLTAAMYHRFHAPHNLRVDRVRHIQGDSFNVNPPALARVDRLFCRNERVIIRTMLEKTDYVVTLVPVAAILVAGIRLRFLDLVVNPRYSTTIPCNNYFEKGQEMGWFEHGSTILVLAPKGIALCEGARPALTIRMGEDLMRIEGGVVLPKC